MGWTNGDYHSSWIPLIAGRRNHLRGPSDLWRSIAYNLSRKRAGSAFIDIKVPTGEKIAKLIDDRTQEETLAQSISLSLRSMDISVEQISEYYNERLVDLLSSGHIDGQMVATTLDQTLFAQVHSFFVHLGAARDYLGALIAARIGKDPQKVDSMVRLVTALHATHFGSDRLLEFLRSSEFVQLSSSKGKTWEISGWLKEVSDLRNELVHRRPYGSKSREKAGYAVAILPKSGLYRYFRPLVLHGSGEKDVLDVVNGHYRVATNMFQNSAELSGYDTSILTLTDKDVISLKTTRR